MPKPPPPVSGQAHYPHPTETTFVRALATLAKSLPAHHAALAALLVEGRFHEPEAILAVLQGAKS